MPTKSRFKKDLRFIHRMSQEFAEDLRFSHQLLSASARRSAEDQSGDWKDLNYHLKTALRCFFGVIDSQTFAMRKVIGRSADTIEISKRDLARVLERRYDPEQDRITDEVARTGFGRRFKLALRYFPQIFGSDFRFDAGTEEYRGFVALLKERNKFTHPRQIEDLFSVKSLLAFRKISLWYFDHLRRLISECGDSVGLNLGVEVQEWPRFQDSDLEGVPSASDIFDDQFYTSVNSSSAQSIEYLRFMMIHLLGDDLIRAHKQVLEYANGDSSQFARRNLARVLFSVAEGTAGAINFYLSGEADRNTIEVSDSEKADLERRKFSPDNLVKICKTFAEKVGFNQSPSKLSPNWNKFTRAHRIRDHVTHPRTLRQLKVSDRDLDTLLGAVSWYLDEILGNLGLSAGSGAEAGILDRFPVKPEL